MEKWLSDIIKDGTLVDNQSFKVNEGLFQKNAYNQEIRLNARRKGEHVKFWNDNEAVWWFLSSSSEEINKNLIARQSESLVLFNNQDYEHNTDDNFLNISGYNAYNFSLSTSNTIGYIKKGNYALKVGSRFGDAFLKYIIADAEGFLEIENYGGQNNQAGFKWLLIYLWKIKLKKALRLGLPKQYVSHTRRLNKVRGNVDATDYFLTKKSPTYQCTYRAHSYNNDIVKLIAATFTSLKGNSLLTDMHQHRNAFLMATEGERTSLPKLLQTQKATNPFYNDYNEVIALSKRILKNDVAAFGEYSETSAFFFDVSMLFEYFVKKLLMRNGFKMLSKFTASLSIETGTRQRQLQPDLLFKTEAGLFVIDVKYKNFDYRYGVNREDLFQLHTYIGQFGNTNKLAGCGFVYPSKKEKNEFLEKSINIMGEEVPFYICLLAIPDTSDENEFNTAFTKNCNDFIVSLKTKTN